VLTGEGTDSCNFALLSYARGVDYQVSALGDSSWAKVNEGGNFMISRCGMDSRGLPKGVPEGGVVAIPSSEFLSRFSGVSGFWKLTLTSM